MEKIRSIKLFIYCAPAFAFAIPTFPIMILLPQIYATDHNLALATIGGVLFLGKVLDVFSDPLMGWVCDKNFISRKLWIIVGTIISGIAFYKLILPLNTPDGLYLFVWISFLYIGWTVFQVSYLSLGYDLDSDYYGRSKLSASREFFVILGLLASVSLPVLINQNLMKSEEIVLNLALISGGVSVLIFSLVIPEKKRVKFKSAKNIFSTLKELKHNDHLLKLLIPWFLNCLANSFPMILFVFFVTSVLDGEESDKEFILFLYFLSALVGMFFWVFLSNYLEKKNIWRFSMFSSAIIFLFVFLLESGDITAFLIISCLTGFCLGADLSIPLSIQSDVTDYHKEKFNNDISGILFSLLIFLNKFTLALATIISFSLLDFYEFEANETAFGEVKYLIIFLYAGTPIILKLIVVIMLKNFNLTKEKVMKITKKLYG